MKPISYLLIFIFSLCVSPPVTLAQDALPDGTLPSASPSSEVNASRVSTPQNSELLFRTRTGELVPVADLLQPGIVEELLRRAQDQTSIPRYTIAHAEFTGTIDRDKIELSVELRIQINLESEWVTVPLAFGDVYVEAFDATSEPANSQALFTSGDQNNRQWHLRGKGLHTVRMSLVGKPRTISPGVSQLNLNLPQSTASHSVLTFSSPVEIQKLPTGAVDKSTRDAQGVRSVEFWGLPASFSMTWSEVVARVAQKPVIQVQNRMKLDLTTIPVTLTGTQNLQITGGPISEVKVAFPEGFQLVEADARNAAGISVLNNFESPATPGTAPAIIRLTSPIEGTVTVSFDLELINRTFPQDIKVSLPSLQDVNQQPGDLEILFPTGLLVQQTELKGAQRIRVPSESDLSVAATAFRMRSPESQIVLHVEETEAQFAVFPELSLQPDPQNVILTVRYPVSVLKGSLLDLSIIWPGYSSGDWQILRGTMRLISGKTNQPLSMKESSTENDVLQLTFPERQSGEFVVEFSAFAALAAVRSGNIQLRCPEVLTRRAQPFIIKTIESDEYSIRPISMGTGEPLPTIPASAPVASNEVEPKVDSESWLLDDPSIPVRLELPRQTPYARAEITLGMQPRENGIEVQELIRFEIEHRDMPALTLQVPEGLRPTVRVAGQPEPLRGTIDWIFRLPEARRGTLNIEISYLWPAPPDAAQVADYVYQLPIILPQPADVLSVQVGTSSLSGLTIKDPLWAPVYSERFESAMETTESVNIVPLHWTGRLSATSSSSPDLIFVQSRIMGTQAFISTLAVYDSVPEFVSAETAADADIEAILLGDQSLNSDVFERTLIQRQQIVDRNVNRWTIAARKIQGSREGPMVLEFRVRQKLSAKPALWLTPEFQRVQMNGESSAVPVVWSVGSQDEYQAVTANVAFSSLTQRAATMLPGSESMAALTERQLRAVLSPFTKELQTIMADRADEWLRQPGRHDLFFGSADSGPLKVYLVPHVSLLLVTALSCVLFFLAMSMFRQITVVVPFLFLSCMGLVTWLLFPERTLMLAPYIGMGLLLGLISMALQRLFSERRLPFPTPGRTTEFPTVFGYSGVLPSPLNESIDVQPMQPARSSEISVGSAR